MKFNLIREHFFIPVLLLGLVVLLHSIFDSIYLSFGMHSDDWICLVRFNALSGDFFHKALIFWKLPEIGPHATSQIMYMGFLERIVGGLNYRIFDLVNICFKILATISLYPLILLIFNRKLLAFLAVLLYAMSYSTVGSFHDVVKGTEYQAIFFMNIFLIIYAFLTKKQLLSIKGIFALIFSFGIAIFLAPPRLFPLILLPFFIEFFIWICNRRKYSIKIAAKKLIFLYLPFFLLFIYHPSVVTDTFIAPATHVQKIIEGHWFTLLAPFSGVGYMVLWGSYWSQMIGILDLDSLINYIIFLVLHTLPVFGIITSLLVLAISNNKKRVFFFTTFINFILEIPVFFLATNHLKIPLGQRVGFDPNVLYSVFVGIYIISFGAGCLLEWFKERQRNGLLLALWSGSFFSFYFVFFNWLLASTFLSFSSSQEYLTIPAIGVSLFMASLLVGIYDRIKNINLLGLGAILAFCTIFLLLIPFYLINKVRTTEYLTSIVNQNNAYKQKDLQQKITQQLRLSTKKNVLVFFDWTNDKINSEFYSEYLYSTFTFWTHFENRKIIEGCINEITDKKLLTKSFIQQNDKAGFILPGNCLTSEEKDFFVDQKVFYDLKNFYAFKIENNNLTDIRKEIVNDLRMD